MTEGYSVARDSKGMWRVVPFAGLNHPSNRGCWPTPGMARDAAEVGNRSPPLQIVVSALENIGYDVTCGACMALALTASNSHAHTCCSGARDAAIALAAKRELLEEIAQRARQLDERNAHWSYCVQSAYDEAETKYTTTEPAQEAPRAIVPNSEWRYRAHNGAKVRVWRVDRDSVHAGWLDSQELRSWSIERFRGSFTWVSDPTEPAADAAPVRHRVCSRCHGDGYSECRCGEFEEAEPAAELRETK